MNRIAWLGQASMCYATGVPSKYSAGFYILSKDQQDKANRSALEFLNLWLEANKLNPVTLNEGLAFGRQVNIY
jgi:hypothetical protein